MRSPEGLNANYRGRMVDTHGVRRDSDAVKAMSVNMESPQDRHAKVSGSSEPARDETEKWSTLRE